MIRIGIVDDHAIVRLGLREFFLEQEGLCIAGEAADGREAIELVRRTKIDVLLMDLNMPGQSGVDALIRIRAAAPEVAVLVFTAYPQEHYAAILFQLGASGFLSKECDPIEIVRAIRELALGHRHLTPALAALLAARLEGRSEAPHNRLSEREFQVFLKLASGMRPCTIAPDLSLSAKTVSSYRGRVMAKLRLSSTSELTYYALKHRLLS
jgi:two-component system, NarL family, invasion response regulator UvrY